MQQCNKVVRYVYMPPKHLDRSKNLWLDKVTTLDNLVSSASIGNLSVCLEQLGHVELGSLEDLGLSDVDVVQWVDSLHVRHTHCSQIMYPPW